MTDVTSLQEKYSMYPSQALLLCSIIEQDRLLELQLQYNLRDFEAKMLQYSLQEIFEIHLNR